MVSAEELQLFLTSMLGRVLVAVGIVLFSVAVARIVSHVMYLRAKRKEDPGTVTKLAFLRRMVSATIIVLGVVAAIYTIPQLQKIAVSLFAGAGVLALVIGFASQKALSNIVAGIFITIYKPFRIGDVVVVNNQLGTVEDINFRHTVIRTYEDVRLVIPNGILSDMTIENRNLVDNKVRKHIVVGIGYESDVKKAKKILQTICEKHPLCIDVRTRKQREQGHPKVEVIFTGLGESAVTIRAHAWCKGPEEAWELSCDVYEEVLEQFKKHGITIPYPQRTIHIQK